MERSKVIEFYEPRKGTYDFYRCAACGAIFTHEYERLRLDTMAKTDDKNMWIHCRSMKYKGAFPYFLEWLKPSILLYTIKLVLARGLYPWAEKNRPSWLPRIEKLISNRLTRDELPAKR